MAGKIFSSTPSSGHTIGTAWTGGGVRSGAHTTLKDDTPKYLQRLVKAKDRSIERAGEWTRQKAASMTPIRTSAMANGWYWTTLQRSNYAAHAAAARKVAEGGEKDILGEIDPRPQYVRVSNCVRYAAAVNDGSEGRPGYHMMEQAAQMAREHFPKEVRWRISNALGSEWGVGVEDVPDDWMTQVGPEE